MAIGLGDVGIKQIPNEDVVLAVMADQVVGFFLLGLVLVWRIKPGGS